jgi:hypothetical protein
MPLNLLKVQKLLYSAGFLIDTYFVMGNLCRFLRATSIVTGDNIIIFISSTYDFILEDNVDTVFSIKLIEFENGNKVSEQYGDYPTGKVILDMYGQSVNIKDESKDDQLEAEMENNYKKKIDLKSMDRDQIVILKDCCRQLRRLYLAMHGVRYSLCIIQDNYLCIVDDDNIDCYYVKRFNSESRSFIVVADLEYFYEKLQSVNTDINLIKSSIYSVLDKNTTTNIETLVNVTKKLNAVNIGDKKISRKKQDYMQQLQRHKIRLEEYAKQEKSLKGEIGSIETDGGFFNDAIRINKRAGLESQIDEINGERQKLIKLVVQLRKKCDNLYLNSDRVDFDNCILVNSIAKNFSELEEILKSN